MNNFIKVDIQIDKITGQFKYHIIASPGANNPLVIGRALSTVLTDHLNKIKAGVTGKTLWEEGQERN